MTEREGQFTLPGYKLPSQPGINNVLHTSTLRSLQNFKPLLASLLACTLSYYYGWAERAAKTLFIFHQTLSVRFDPNLGEILAITVNFKLFTKQKNRASLFVENLKHFAI